MRLAPFTRRQRVTRNRGLIYAYLFITRKFTLENLLLHIYYTLTQNKIKKYRPGLIKAKKEKNKKQQCLTKKYKQLSIVPGNVSLETGILF